MPAVSIFNITGGNPQSVGTGETSLAQDTTKHTVVLAENGLTSYELVEKAATQTLTNKTLTSPTITSPTITGTPVLNTVTGAFSTAQVAGAYSSDTYLAGSKLTMPTGGWVAGGRFYWMFDMVKTGAGTAQFTINIRLGAAGTTADTSIQSIAFASGTANADTGLFEVFGHFRTVGATTTAVIVSNAFCSHHLAATGLVSTGASGFGQVTSVSSGFDSTTANGFLGISINGGASFSGTNTIVEAEYHAF